MSSKEAMNLIRSGGKYRGCAFERINPAEANPVRLVPAIVESNNNGYGYRKNRKSRKNRKNRKNGTRKNRKNKKDRKSRKNRK